MYKDKTTIVKKEIDEYMPRTFDFIKSKVIKNEIIMIKRKSKFIK